MSRFSRVFDGTWSVILFLTAASIYLYALMEWVFFVTKPSFMSGMGVWAQIQILLLAALGVSVLPLLVVLVLALIANAAAGPSAERLLAVPGSLVPAFILAALILLLVDNFTYTVFRFGIVSTERVPRAAYGLSFLMLLGYVYLRVRACVQARGRKKQPVRSGQRLLLWGMLSLSLLLSAYSLVTRPSSAGMSADMTGRRDLPNIILLGSDGLDAAQLSVYGYERETTPNLQRLLPEALFAENAFPNGGTTAGSVASILTGKPPVETRVVYPPDILNGEDSYQHLPGILKRLGYRTVDLSVPYFGDALTLNMQGGFDVANQRSGVDAPPVRLTRFLGGGDAAYFVDAMLQRISERLLHIFFLKPMTDPYEAVIEPASREDEQKRFDELIAALEATGSPIFLHVHMLGTHGPRFEIRRQVFSEGQTQSRDWMPDFYDDAVLNFDRYVGELFDYLSDSGKLENTVVVIYSDHGQRWTVHERVPLLFWFPGGEHAGAVVENVQNIDIAPTLLDYLGLSVPGWMSGQSLLGEELDSPQYIFSASVDPGQIEVAREGYWIADAERRRPPFYQLGYVGLVACNRWFELYLQEPVLLYGAVDGHTRPCAPASLPSPEQAREILLEHLAQNGYDTSGFPDSVPVQYRP